MILVYPPLAKPSEPPSGLAKLAGALNRHHLPFRLLDANLEGILYLLNEPLESPDTWTTRALRHLHDHLNDLRTIDGYHHLDRYRQAVLDLNRILTKSASKKGVRISFANYTEKNLSPLRSGDLLRAAECFESNAFYPYFCRRLGEVIEEEDPGAIGFSMNYLSQAICTFSMAGFIRRSYPSVKIILGGGLVTSWMRKPDWKDPFVGLIDAMVAGPGEQALVRFLGASYSEGTDMPDYAPLRANRYFAPGFVLPFSGSTGCYWHRCCFCPEKAEGNPHKTVSPAKCVDAARILSGETNPCLVHFLDNAMTPVLLEEIARRSFGYPWYGFVRADPRLGDQDFCRALKRSGCLMLKLGVESGAQDVLESLHKGIDLGTVSRVLKTLRSAGIGTYVYLLFGTPPENLEKARQTLAFTVRHADCITFLNVALFNMPLYGPDARTHKTKPFYEGDLSLYTAFEHPLGWDRPKVRAFLDREFNRHPAVAAIQRREPPLFTSNHAPFFIRGNRTES